MGDPTIPTAAERAATLQLAKDNVTSVIEDLEGPFQLPDFAAVRSQDRRIEMLKAWWTDTDIKIFRMSQDLVDSRAALELACALLAELEEATNQPVRLADRLRRLDLTTPEAVAEAQAAGQMPPAA